MPHWQENRLRKSLLEEPVYMNNNDNSLEVLHETNRN